MYATCFLRPMSSPHAAKTDRRRAFDLGRRSSNGQGKASSFDGLFVCQVELESHMQSSRDLLGIIQVGCRACEVVADTPLGCCIRVADEARLEHWQERELRDLQQQVDGLNSREGKTG